jgi:hypothetical protein
MGHVRLGKLPQSRHWRQVVALLKEGPDVPELAALVSTAAERDLDAARGDPALASTVWLLVHVPLAAQTDRFAAELSALGFSVGSEASLGNLVANFPAAVERDVGSTEGRTDLGVLARKAAAETLSALVGSQVDGLFETPSENFRRELAKFATKDRFAVLARDFFSRLTHKTIDYYISRVLADHVGPDRTLGSLDQYSDFQLALRRHCHEASFIVEQFAGGWLSKARHQGTLSREATRGFTDYALKKMRDELRVRRSDSG